MFDLTNKALPNTVMVGGRAFSINTDFRLWMKFEINIAKGNIPMDVTYLFRGEMPTNCSIDELLVFSRPHEELPRPMGRSDDIVIDYEYDGSLIYAAILGQYGLDLTEVEYLHWHKFLALIRGLNENTVLRNVMGYRVYEKSTKKNDDQYAKLKEAWRVERKTQEDIEAEERFLSYFE